MYDSILVPTDGSVAAETATDGALALAERFDAALHVIHVVERDEFPAEVRSEASADAVQRGETMLGAIAERANDAGVPVTTQVIETDDEIHREIVDYATEHGVDLVAMGTHGRTGLNRLLLGSVAERTLRVAPMPVLTVHEDAAVNADFETILVPIDGSETATAAADHAIGIAATTGAAFHVVHAVDTTAAAGEFAGGAVLQALEEAGQEALDEVRERAGEAGVGSVEASVLSGIPHRAIVDYAADHGTDLIVMGTHGRSGLDRYLLGSVTEKVVRLSDTPVLSISAGDPA